jgi:hypothetical protein
MRSDPKEPGHEEEGAEADRRDLHRQKIAAALLGVEIAKRKQVWEKSPSAPECGTKNDQAILEQSLFRL